MNALGPAPCGPVLEVAILKKMTYNAHISSPVGKKEDMPLAEEFDKVREDGQEEISSPAPGPKPETQEPPRRPGADLFEWLQMIMGCVLVAVVLFNCFARLTRVDGHSMDNTLQDGEMMLVWDPGYRPKQGDIVVLNKKTAAILDNRAIVKRVIAVGGQTVDIDYESSTIYVDGQPLDEPYIKEEMYRPDPLRFPEMQQTHWEIPEGSIFVMGDNRNHSTDSRHDDVGPVDEGYVLGKVIFALLPLSKFGPM